MSNHVLTPDFLMSHEDAYNFILGGKAHFTILNSKSGIQFTFEAKKKHNTWWIYYTGLYAGFINNAKVFIPGVKYKPEDKHPMKDAIMQFSWVWTRLEIINRSEQELARTIPLSEIAMSVHRHVLALTPIEFYHHGECGVCGRPLTDPESKRRGIGPICLSKMFS